jgi:hypothetical protein
MAKQVNPLAHEPPAVVSGIHATHQQIAALAYTQWRENGYPEGTHEEDWYRAERTLTENRGGGTDSASWSGRRPE